MQNARAKKIFAILLALVSWLGLGLQFYLILQTRISTGFSTFKTIVNFLSYFTILSNLLVAVSSTAVVLTRAPSFFTRAPVQSAIALYIFIVAQVYNIILRSIWEPEGWQLVADNLLHAVIPLLYIVYWLVFIPRQTLRWKDLFPWLIFPGIYLLYSIVRGVIVHWYPYPFLDTSKSSVGEVAINALFMLLAFVISGLAMIAINRSGTKKG